MNFKEMTDNEILEYLMTSDFNEEDLSNDDLKFLLKKYRNFYRILHGMNNRNIIYKDSIIKRLEEEIEKLKKELFMTKKLNAELEDKINNIRNKKLSLKERIYGKIII